MIPYTSLGMNADYGGSGSLGGGVPFGGSAARATFIDGDASGPIRTILSIPSASYTANNGDNSFSGRQRVPLSPLANGGISIQPPGLLTGGFRQIRLGFMAGDAGWHVDNVAIGVWSGTNYDFARAPTELFFGGKSGFAIPNTSSMPTAQSIMSDWVNFTILPTEELIVSWDNNAVDGQEAGRTAATLPSNDYTWGLWSGIPKYNVVSIGAPDAFGPENQVLSGLQRIDVR